MLIPFRNIEYISQTVGGCALNPQIVFQGQKNFIELGYLVIISTFHQLFLDKPVPFYILFSFFHKLYVTFQTFKFNSIQRGLSAHCKLVCNVVFVATTHAYLEMRKYFYFIELKCSTFIIQWKSSQIYCFNIY